MNKNLSVIAGIGNPGERYERTLHNVGFWFVDEIAATNNLQFSYHKKFDAEVCQVNISKNDIWLIKPQNYMNMSGGPIKAFLNYYQIPTSGMLVVHDEIDLPSNKVKLKVDGGHGGHNGLRSIFKSCQGSAFLRIRIGIGHPNHHNVINYVLSKPKAEEERKIHSALDSAIDATDFLLKNGVEKAMSVFNQKV